jgi:hypothetical protein
MTKAICSSHAALEQLLLHQEGFCCYKAHWELPRSCSWPRSHVLAVSIHVVQQMTKLPSTVQPTFSPRTKQQGGCPKGLHQGRAVYQVHSECQGALPQLMLGIGPALASWWHCGGKTLYTPHQQRQLQNMETRYTTPSPLPKKIREHERPRE